MEPDLELPGDCVSSRQGERSEADCHRANLRKPVRRQKAVDETAAVHTPEDLAATRRSPANQIASLAEERSRTLQPRVDERVEKERQPRSIVRGQHDPAVRLGDTSELAHRAFRLVDPGKDAHGDHERIGAILP